MSRAIDQLWARYRSASTDVQRREVYLQVEQEHGRYFANVMADEFEREKAERRRDKEIRALPRRARR
jgi:RNA polymerase-binding transcription factor DksA